jgi:glycine dehydrogenase
VSQSRLEALLNFQILPRDLNCLDLASASLLDEATLRLNRWRWL